MRLNLVPLREGENMDMRQHVEKEGNWSGHMVQEEGLGGMVVEMSQEDLYLETTPLEQRV
jgi:hypothetical protein